MTEDYDMNKRRSFSIRVNGEGLNKLKSVVELENYSLYSEFIRRIALKEADKIKKYSKQNPCSIAANAV